MPPITLRPSRPSDADAVIALLMGTYHATWEPHLRPEAAARFGTGKHAIKYVEGYLDQFTVAERAGQVVGMVHARGDFLDALHVLPACQGEGIGGRLLAVAEEGMRREGLAMARLETDTFNERSRAFYRRHGYVETDTYPDEEWDSGFTTVLMTKPLIRKG
ncbi:MAG: Aminoalkylphosphonate N-acetyltransferase [Luteibacter sp.]|nr:MAG: Aminoalkylphosphonate N-acetyltransferase [Luteibacter sp.]